MEIHFYNKEEHEFTMETDKFHPFIIVRKDGYAYGRTSWCDVDSLPEGSRLFKGRKISEDGTVGYYSEVEK